MPALLTSKFTWAVVVIAVVMAAFGIQGGRLARAKADQINPATHRPWKEEAQASAKALATCQGEKAAAEQAAAKANASVEQLAALGGESIARVRSQIAGVSGQVAALRVTAASLKAYQPKGADLCARWNDADARVREALQ